MINRLKACHLSTVCLALAAVWLSSCAQRVTVRESPAIGAEKSKVPLAQAIAERNSQPSAYNTAVAGVARKLNRQWKPDSSGTVTLTEQGTPLQVKIATGPATPWGISDIESIRPTEFLRIKGMREHIKRVGTGAPVVLKMAPVSDTPYTFAPHSGTFVPATALIEATPGGSPQDFTFTLFDPLSPRGPDTPLAADYTAGLASTFAKWYRLPINLPAMLRPERFEKQFGMVKIDSVYPEKIPVVFIHGLKSSSSTWKDVINELREEPAIRERFEFWVFGYGTGAPIPYSAMLLRESLQEMAAYRKSLGAPSNDMILVGHSMGGLLSRIMTTSSGDENWFRFFNRPIEDLKISEENRELLRDVAYYEKLPFVKRIVFIATPHRGSQFADNPIGRLGSELIRLPKNLLFLSGTIIHTSLEVLTPFGQQVVTEIPTSIDLLESDSMLLKLLADDPLNPAVEHHSIIGNRKKHKAELLSDGVVTYESAHLNGAISEKIIPAGHAVHQHPETVAELQRILLEHLGR